MYGMIKFQDWEVRKETKNSQLCYYYKDEKIDEKELEQYISITKIRKNYERRCTFGITMG